MGNSKWCIRALSILSLVSVAPALAQEANGVGTPFELAFWQSVSGSDDPALYEAYLQQYPAGTFSVLARAKLAGIRKAAGQPAEVAASPGGQAHASPLVGASAVSAAAPRPLAPSAMASAALAAPAKPAVPLPAPVSAPRPVQPVPLVAPAPQPVALASPGPVPAPAIAPARAMAMPSTSAPSARPAANATSEAAADIALLAELARSQEAGGSTAGVAAAAGFALPPRPGLLEVPDLQLPASFCSAEERNAFHETRYRPVLALARANNEAAVGHLNALQQAYNEYQARSDPTPMNAIAVESSTYQQQVAAIAFARQSALVQQFDAIMAVPIVACPPAGERK